MIEEKEMFLNVRLIGQEIENFEEAKEKSGIRSNAELVRHLIKLYTSKVFVPPIMRETK